MEECIVRTLVFFDIFDYPLTFDKLKKYLCCKSILSDDELYDFIESIPIVHQSKGQFYLMGRSKLIPFYEEKYSISLEKYVKVRIVGKLLSFIPTIKYIGVGGNLAIDNSTSSENIELTFITSRNTLWLTRFLVDIVLFLTKQHKFLNNKHSKGKIVASIFLEIDGLASKANRKTLFDAYSIVKLNSIFDRSRIYEYLLSKNKWINDYFPNIAIKHKSKVDDESYFTQFLKPINYFLYTMYKFFGQIKLKKARVGLKYSFVEYENKRKIIMDLYRTRTRRYLRLLADNIWVDNSEARYYMDDKKVRVLN